MTDLKLGLIGTGRIGRLHAELLTTQVRGAQLLAITDAFAESAQQCAADFGIARVEADATALLTDPNLDAVLICSSTDTHVPLIMAAAEDGKHVFCEKPIALDLASVDRALAAVETAGVTLQIGFNRRFHPAFQRVRELIAAGEIGQPQLVRITSRDPSPPPISYVKVSGGIFLDMTIHDFDMARYLLDAEIETVYATGGVLIDPAIGEAGDIDTAVVVLTAENGAICTIDNSRQAVYGYDQRLEVFGSAGTAMATNETPYRTRHYTRHSGHTPLPYQGFLDLYRQAYVAELQAFVDAVTHGTPSPVTGRDGRAPLLIGLAAQRSLQEQRLVHLREFG